jgi:hypothetical protein
MLWSGVSSGHEKLKPVEPWFASFGQSPASNGGAVNLIIMGNHQGYLTPCGCSDPMIGGILREASLIRNLQARGPSIVIDTGDLTASSSRQEVMKVQTLAETLKSLNVVAVNLTPSELKLGAGNLLSLQELSGNAFTTATLSVPSEVEVEDSKIEGGFEILGLGPGNVKDELVRKEIEMAKSQHLRIAAMLEDTEAEAQALARNYPEIDVIAYKSASAPSSKAEKIGKTLIVSPGEHGEYLLSIGFSTSGATAYSSYKLTPDIPDDPIAGRYYRTYLRRVDQDPGLWENLARSPGKAFAGAAACAKCHESEYKIWRDKLWVSNGQPSGHSRALQTLSDKGHGKDPECLPCHVTGASVMTGFHSRALNPQLAFVGCEACHGAGAEHAANPWKRQMPRSRSTNWPQVCLTCHTSLNSPNFDFDLYWARIKHGNGDKWWKSKK